RHCQCMWKNQGSWNFFHTKLIPNSSSCWVREDLFAGYNPTQSLGRTGPIRWVQLYSTVG
ncbi:hypothetical protein, partial [Prevotella histicola]|uniref:hypothetical protein n=1 Tax=Prevotella histicola TaxID=470565 RepID=UPI001C5E85D1